MKQRARNRTNLSKSKRLQFELQRESSVLRYPMFPCAHKTQLRGKLFMVKISGD